jgi:uncharacterized protein YdeI (YjbR/CyaY-like superfamily)
METYKNIEVRPFKDPAVWEAWLAKNYTRTEGIWIKVAKKASGIPTIDHGGALDVALCYGWIDGQSKTLDDTWYLQKFTPRRPRSLWSKINIAKVEALIAAGNMQPSGMAEIEAAKADGRWAAAYESPANAAVPPEFVQAFRTNKKAEAFFESLNKTNKYAFIWRVMTAKKPETRAARVAKLLAMLEAGEKFH